MERLESLGFVWSLPDDYHELKTHNSNTGIGKLDGLLKCCGAQSRSNASHSYKSCSNVPAPRYAENRKLGTVFRFSPETGEEASKRYFAFENDTATTVYSNTANSSYDTGTTADAYPNVVVAAVSPVGSGGHFFRWCWYHFSRIQA